MTKKLAFFDIDGTLLDHNKKLPDSTVKTINDLQQQGVYCAIATGRAPFMYETIRADLGITSFISFNGQYVVLEGTPVYKNPLNHKELDSLYEKAIQNNHPVVFMNEETMRATRTGSERIRQALQSLHFDYPSIDDKYHEKRDMYQSLLFCEGNEIESYKESHRAFDYIRWHKYSCDIIPRGGSKAEGIRKLIEAADVDMSNVYAFGDGLNDVEMIRDVGTGIAMGNAVPEVKEVSDYVTDDVAEDGLMKAVYEVGLLN
ncbi:Cof-type HAD-IIB family hydrolase [Salimicrobium sp. PL1-032A]|uniref:Cof-type HAD-IIB family hydrolase n=1 Tax=Salimicrobium sp. PL1-032A TaxID=3095364 RepID=UPI003261688C